MQTGARHRPISLIGSHSILRYNFQKSSDWDARCGVASFTA